MSKKAKLLEYPASKSDGKNPRRWKIEGHLELTIFEIWFCDVLCMFFFHVISESWDWPVLVPPFNSGSQSSSGRHGREELLQLRLLSNVGGQPLPGDLTGGPHGKTGSLLVSDQFWSEWSDNSVVSRHVGHVCSWILTLSGMLVFNTIILTHIPHNIFWHCFWNVACCRASAFYFGSLCGSPWNFLWHTFRHLSWLWFHHSLTDLINDIFCETGAATCFKLKSPNKPNLYQTYNQIQRIYRRYKIITTYLMTSKH